ncbi:MAG: glycosyltransferase family 4 protein [Gammaproteobacteria bacterium]|nr:glycosyltransferase family 4 protein [Gammaproteobacteria bacterium]
MAPKVLAISSYKDTWNSVRPEGEMLIALARAGAEVTVMTQGDADYAARFRDAGLGLIDYHPARKFSLSAIRRIRAELKAGAFDVVYCFNNKAIASTVWAAIGLPVKVVTYRGQTGNISRWDPACYLTHLHPRVDGIICVANAVRDDLRPQSSLPAERIVTVYKGHEPEWYAGIEPADLTTLGVPAGAPVVVCVANARPRKGVPVLLEAFHRLPDNGWQLLLVGGGMDSPEFRSLINAGPAAGRIHVAGFRKDVLNLVAACRIGVLPTIKREGLPKTVIEAMALGLPVVVTTSGGSQELVVDGITGAVVAAGDVPALATALATLMIDEQRCRQMGAAARHHLFSQFTARQAGEQTFAYFNRLCGR